ncbi:Remorin, C-terminal [Trema orientale]|uniref:Remorin, C-terminal n=1 Tax=Trema orientale TaxID=63057 RepID=A0A2P5AUG9_TREOI|nr:Remorin, C-terminal [Trema orientale]
MDNLYKQTRVRFSGLGQEKKEASGSGKDQKIPAQKTQSFKDKKKDQNWFRRQFSRQMSQDYDSNEGIDYAIAVAAAACAITSLKESGIPGQKQTREEPGASSVTSKSRKEDATVSIHEPGQGSAKSSEDPDSKVPITAATDTKKPEKALLPAPSFRKTASAVEKELGSSSKLGRTTSKPELSAKPAPNLFEVQQGPDRGNHKQIPGKKLRWPESQKGICLKMTEIFRYEKQRSTILDWEDKKKTKAKRRLDRTERQLEGKRAKALRKFRGEMQHIDQVAGGARAKAEENKRNDMLKVKEKANTIRRTGIVPKTCFCF